MIYRGPSLTGPSSTGSLSFVVLLLLLTTTFAFQLQSLLSARRQHVLKHPSLSVSHSCVALFSSFAENAPPSFNLWDDNSKNGKDIFDKVTFPTSSTEGDEFLFYDTTSSISSDSLPQRLTLGPKQLQNQLQTTFVKAFQWPLLKLTNRKAGSKISSLQEEDNQELLSQQQQQRLDSAQVAVAQHKAHLVQPPQPTTTLSSQQDLWAGLEATATAASATQHQPTQQQQQAPGSSSRLLIRWRRDTTMRNNDDRHLLHSYFPEPTPIVKSWKQLKRFLEAQYTKVQSTGRVGLLAYCFFNFLFYTIGILYQWNRIVVAHPSTTSVSVVLLKKFARVLASLYLYSTLLKIPKILSAVALAPVSKNCLDFTQKRFQLRSETLAAAVLVGVMAVVWGSIISVPILAEYARLCRLVELEKLLLLGS